MMQLSYKGIALGGLGGFLGGFALTILAQASGLAAVASVPIVAILPIFTVLGAIVEGVEETKK